MLSNGPQLSQLSLFTSATVNCAAPSPSSTTSICGPWHRASGGSTSVTTYVTEHVAMFPAASVTFHSTVVEPTGSGVPPKVLFPVSVLVRTNGPQLSEYVGFNSVPVTK
ncbi:MAG: hypothetical protein PGMFKBFP_02406 [Anaerolineales bacterium]|nr:hypothetical protein [Anaerolineales bacterium]